jgi:hypothetical protein
MKLFASFSKLAAASFLAVTGFATATTASADLSDLRGTWINIDENTRGLTKVVIGGSGDIVSMSAWGSCSPSDCEWGEVPATPLTNSVSAPLASADRIVAVYEKSFKMAILNAYRVGEKLVVDNATDFKDNRSDTFHSYTFKRMPVWVTPGIVNTPVIINPGVLPKPVLDLSLFQPVSNLDQLEGVWTNVDANTRGITKIKINVDGADVKSRAWGSCSPSDCDWGWVAAQPLTASISDAPETANSILSVWDSSIAKRSAVMTRTDNMLTVQVTTVYKDNRSDRLNTYVFTK